MDWSLISNRIKPKISNLPGALYGIYIDGELASEAKIKGGDDLQISVTVNGVPKDVVIMTLGNGY